MKLPLSTDDQQWLLIVRAGCQSARIPNDVRASLAARGLVNETGDVALTDLGLVEAEAIAAANFKLNLTPPPSKLL
jgi:hypothetical protein